jgi:hypothetical protein
MTKGSTYSSYNALRFFALFVVAVCIFSCSKPDDIPTPTPPPVTPPASTQPTGVIDSYSIDDTLIKYNSASFGRWQVSGFNSLTTVTWGGNKVGYSGGISTGLLKKDTLLKLSVNSGAERSQMVHVADIITSKLYNDGKFAQKIKTEVFSQGVFTDTAMAGTTSEEHVFFNLDGSTTIINIITPSPPNGGPFTIVDIGMPPTTTPASPGTPNVFRWRNTDFTVVTLTTQQLVVKYQAYDTSGAWVDWRDTYSYN